jgi:hypothetical protein
MIRPMAPTPYPLPASIRQTAVLVATGIEVYGPFGDGWGIFDLDDVKVETRAAATDPWVVATVTIEKVDPIAEYGPFNIRFPLPYPLAGVEYRVTGDRLHRRDVGVTLGGIIDGKALEKELSKQTVVLQEMRRDVDGAILAEAEDAADIAALDTRLTANEALDTSQGVRITVLEGRSDDFAAAAGFRDFQTLTALLADTSLTYVGGLPGTVALNDTIRTRKEGYAYQVALAGATDHDATTAGGIKLYARGEVIPAAQTLGAPALAKIAFRENAKGIVKIGETAKLICNPSGGDDFQDMAQWVAGRHFVGETGALFLEIAEGLHNVTTFLDVSERRFLDIRGTALPDYIGITGATFAFVSTVGSVSLYTATVTVDTDLPARVATGFSVGGRNVQGDGGADLINRGMTVKTVAGDRRSFTCDILTSGVAPTAFTVPDATDTLSQVPPNQLMIPKNTIRANQAGWDGVGNPREGFINAFSAGGIHMRYVGLSYNGGTGPHDMLFAEGAGSEIRLIDGCSVSGAAAMVLRNANFATIDVYGSSIGGDGLASNIWQGAVGSRLRVVRSMLGGANDQIISATNGVFASISISTMTGANILARATYDDASIIVTSSRLSRGNQAATPTKGNITIDSNSSIRHCTTPFSVTGSNAGTVHGNPALSDNTNAPVTSGDIQPSGGLWLATAVKPRDPAFQILGPFVVALNFPSIAAQGFEDLTIAATGVAFGDFCIVQRATATEPAQTVDYEVFVSAADVITVRAQNYGPAAVDPANFTTSVLVLRSA